MDLSNRASEMAKPGFWAAVARVLAHTDDGLTKGEIEECLNEAELTKPAAESEIGKYRDSKYGRLHAKLDGNRPTLATLLFFVKIAKSRLVMQKRHESEPRWNKIRPALEAVFSTYDIGWTLDGVMPVNGAESTLHHSPTKPSPSVVNVNIATIDGISPAIAFESLWTIIHKRNDDDAPAVELPELGVRDKEAWQASLVARMTQEQIASLLNKQYPGENWTQPRVSEAIKRAMAHARASGLADKVTGASFRAPARTLDPASAELGKRTDGKAHHLRERERQKAIDGDDEE
ncbi:MAG: hypothetical protein HUU18_01525 [Phycisphaerales bacterium]|nr:hypothetical protein [Phycisphaerales bacterium]